MAKQRGIHQISGTINNLCYYEQKYVKGGLIRRVNEGMSGRLKTDPAFENTRIANREFGAASLWAARLLGLLGFRANYMTYPSRQARLTKDILRAIKQFNGGTIPKNLMPSAVSQFALLSAFNKLNKNKTNPLLSLLPTSSVTVEGGDLGLFTLRGVDMDAVCEFVGCDRIDLEVRSGIEWDNGNYDDEDGKYRFLAGEDFGEVSDYTFEKGDTSLEIDLTAGPQNRDFSFVLISATFLRTNAQGTVVERLDGKDVYKLLSAL